MSAAIAGAPTSASAMLPATSFCITPPPSFSSANHSARSLVRYQFPRSEMPDYVPREQPHVIFVRRDRDRRSIEIAVEGRRVVGLVVGHFRTHLDLRGEPVLPPEAHRS